MKGKLYLIPTFLGSENYNQIFPSLNREIIKELKVFIVEEERTARRFLKKIDSSITIDDLKFFVLNEHSKPFEISPYLDSCANESIGLLSEAGTPCVADPGAAIVKLAHTKGIEVIPLIGPSSILLALMASGLNGQSFAFNGYLPIQKNDRARMIKLLEKRSATENQTQLFIETPYRNLQLFDEFLTHCDAETKLCIACDITSENQFIKTFSIKEWKTKKPDIHKRPAIFLILK